ncbi:MAG: hypothetical protein HQL24_02810 [Candidatus Omnitrophica bacterium]|nr:hypothetical protein [Candidatus Omnitrophota bacterium]
MEPFSMSMIGVVLLSAAAGAVISGFFKKSSSGEGCCGTTKEEKPSSVDCGCGCATEVPKDDSKSISAEKEKAISDLLKDIK